MTEQRKKENQEEAKTYLKDENHSKEISKLIDDTLKSGHKILLGSDWHLWIKDRNNPRKCNKRKPYRYGCIAASGIRTRTFHFLRL